MEVPISGAPIALIVIFLGLRQPLLPEGDLGRSVV